MSDMNVERSRFEKFFSKLRQRIVKSQHAIAIGIAALLFMVGVIINPSYASGQNIGSLLLMSTILAFATAGPTLVVISGSEGIDLSVGSVMSLAAIMAAMIMQGENANIARAVSWVLIAGFLIGLVNALGIIVTNIPPLVMTLAMSSLVTTIQLIYTGGTPTGNPAPLMKTIGVGRLFPFLPMLAFVLIGAIIFMNILINRTSYGKQLFAVGNNPNAAHLSGVRIKIVRGMAYVFSGILSAMAGLWFASYLGFTGINLAVRYTMLSVAAVVIGGTSLAGGKGNYTSSVIGAVVLTLLGSLLVLFKTDEAGREIIYGVMLIILLAIYTRQPPIRQ